MITTDGARSDARKWFAKKQVGIISDLGVNAKTVNIDGFTVKVWQLDNDLNGGRITAPMGLIVQHMGAAGLTSCVADFWLGAIDHKATMYAMITNPGDEKATVQEVIKSAALEVQPFKLEPTANNAMQSWEDVDLSADYQDIWGQPNTFPYLGETYWNLATGLFFYDPNQNDIPDEAKYIFELLFNFYCSDGTQANRTCGLIEVGHSAEIIPARIHMGMPPKTVEELIDGEVITKEYQRVGDMQTFRYAKNNAGSRVVGGWFEFRSDDINYSSWTVASMAANVPSSTLRSLMANYATPLGNYQFALPNGEVNQLHFMDAYGHIVHYSTALANFYQSNPSYEPYRLTLFKWSESGGVYTIDSSQFMGVLDSLADNPIDLGGGAYDYDLACHMLLQLFPRPNNNFYAPFDSVMFHSPYGNVYTWTRHYGAVEFSNSGLATYTLHLPSVVTDNDGVRPDIAYAGNDLYTIIATKQGKLTTVPGESDWVGVQGVFVGTPFTSDPWLQMPELPAGYRLRHVRPIKVDVNELGETSKAVFLGVAEQYMILEGETEIPEYPFRACSITYEYNNDEWTGEWSLMTVIPVGGVDDLDQFSVGLYGVGEMADWLKDHPDPQNTYPNMPSIPYELHSGVLP